MKRFFSMILILTLILGLSIPASAWGALQQWWTPSSGTYRLTNSSWTFSGFQWDDDRVDDIYMQYVTGDWIHLGMEWECRLGIKGDPTADPDTEEAHDRVVNPSLHFRQGSLTTTLPSGYKEFDSNDITIGTLRLDEVVANRSYSATFSLTRTSSGTLPGFNSSAELTMIVSNPGGPSPAGEEVHMGNYAGELNTPYNVDDTYAPTSSSGRTVVRTSDRVYLATTTAALDSNEVALDTLASASAEHRALITFDEYLTPAEVEALAEDLEIVEAYFFIPGETGRTIAPIVDNDVTGEVANVAAQLTASDDPEMVRIGNAYEDGDVGVFAISVIGEIGTLRAVQDAQDSVKAIQLHSTAAASVTAEKGADTPVSIIEVPEKPDQADGIF